ncbi:MAG: hypothetical protein AAGC69_06190 [Paracraurococcus sp.]|jgi:hypothetical protein
MLMRLLVIALPILLLGLAGYAAWTAWSAAGETEIGVHGIIALILGSLFTLGITALLIWLMRLSHRRGYDQ